jgi:NitT/TauT family transport system permease protein
LVVGGRVTRSSGASLRRKLLSVSTRRAAISVVVALLFWQLGATGPNWLGARIPIIGAAPSPVAVLQAWSHLVADPNYWRSWYLSLLRVLFGFASATLVGVPFGLLLAVNPTFRAISYPVFELLRPIPPLAWVPASIIFWPTQELSIAFVIFIGAFYTIVINVLGGAEAMDVRLIQAARSMGATRSNIFRRLILPGVAPSIRVGMEVAIGITWEVVVAAEMISSGSGGAGGGLGFFIWNSYIGGSYPNIVVGMISIGIAGYASSTLVRVAAGRLTPWQRT